MSELPIESKNLGYGIINEFAKVHKDDQPSTHP